MKNSTLLALALVVTASCPSNARPHRHHHHSVQAPTSHSQITCEMVRAYVAQVGVTQAKTMAEGAGISESEKQQAIQCLRENKT
jgi:hypothetical protein